MDNSRQDPFPPPVTEQPVPLARAQEPRAVWVVDLRSQRVVRRDEPQAPLAGGMSR